MTEFYLKKGTTNYDISEATVTKECEKAVDMAKVKLSREHKDDFTIGDEVEIYKDSTKLFGGYVYSKDYHKYLELKIESYGGELKRKIAREVYEDKSPEYIVQDLIDNESSLTYASSGSSGITLKRVIIRDRPISEIIEKMCDVLNWQFRTDENKNAYFEERGTASSSASDLVVGSNCILKDKWKEDPKKLMNYIVLKGGSQDFNTKETFSGDGTTKTFTLTYKPTGNVRAVVDGTEKTGQLEGSEGGDFEVDEENKTVTFTTAPSSGTDNVEIYYTYSLPILISRSNPSSISTYGIHAKKVTATWINRFEDGRQLVNKLLETYAEPIRMNCLVVKGINTDYKVGSTNKVTDSYNGINQNMLIYKIMWKIPQNLTYIYVGSEITNFLDMNKSLEEKINELVDIFSRESTIQEYVIVTNDLKVELTCKIKVQTRTIGDTFVWNHPGENGKWNNNKKWNWQGTSYSTHYEDSGY